MVIWQLSSFPLSTIPLPQVSQMNTHRVSCNSQARNALFTYRDGAAVENMTSCIEYMDVEK